MNQKCKNLKDNFYKILNTCELPPMVVYSILLNILYELEKICNEVIQEEQKIQPEEQEYELSLPLPENQDQPQS